MNQLPITWAVVSFSSVARLNGDHFRLLIGANPTDDLVAVRSIGFQDWSHIRRNIHPFIDFIVQLKRANSSGDRMMTDGSNGEIDIVTIMGRSVAVARRLEINTSGNFLVPPRPFLIVNDRVVQNHKSLSRFNK